LKDKTYDIKAVNPNRKPIEDKRTPEQLLDVIDEQGKLLAEATRALRASLSGSPKSQ